MVFGVLQGLRVVLKNFTGQGLAHQQRSSFLHGARRCCTLLAQGQHPRYALKWHSSRPAATRGAKRLWIATNAIDKLTANICVEIDHAWLLLHHLEHTAKTTLLQI